MALPEGNHLLWEHLLVDVASLVMSVLGVLLGVASVLVTIAIYRRQSAQSTAVNLATSSWQSGLDDWRVGLDEWRTEQSEVLRQVAQGFAAIQDSRVLEDIDELDTAPDEGPRPANELAMIDELRRRGAKLDFVNLVWRRKIERGGGRGNLGWFVHSAGDGGDGQRWFVHSGRVVTARPALPLDRLWAWEAATALPPTEIKLDYRSGIASNSAWFVDDYDGRTWRISKGGHGKRTVTVTEIDDADS